MARESEAFEDDFGSGTSNDTVHDGGAYLIAHEVRFHPCRFFRVPWLEIEDDRIILHTTSTDGLQDILEDDTVDTDSHVSLPHPLSNNAVR